MRSRAARWAGRALIVGAWVGLLATAGFCAVAYAIYRDMKDPYRSRWTEGTVWHDLAVETFRRGFWPAWIDNPACAQFDPRVIYAPKPGAVRFAGVEFDTTITITPAGLRYQPGRNEDDERAPIVMAGDSFTMGWGVEDAETFSALLERQYRHPTINTGVPSYGTVRELLRLRQLGLLTRARMVVVQYCPNDAPENHWLVKNPDLLSDGQRTRAQWDHVVSMRRKRVGPDVIYPRVVRALGSALYAHLAMRSLGQFASDFTHRRLRWLDRYGADYPHAADDFLAALDSFPELVGKPVLVIELKDIDERSGFMAALAEKTRGRSNLHLVPLTLEYEDYFRFDGHLNARGHAHVAEQLDRAIRAVGTAGAAP